MEICMSKDHYLHVREVGTGAPAVLALHGWAVSGRLWDPLILRWPINAGRLLVPDLRGTGLSAKPKTGYSLDDYTQDVVEIIDQLGLTGLFLVGHSLGGTIAMRVALLRPAALARLILLSPVPPSGVPLSEPDIAYFRSLGSHLKGMEQVLKMMMARLPEERLMQNLLDAAATVVPESYQGAFDAWRTANFADEVAAISVPTVVMAGELEQPLSPQLLKATVVDRIPGARLLVLPEVGHYPQVEAPDRFAAALLDLIGTAPPLAVPTLPPG